MLPGKMSLKRPKPLRNTVFGAISQATAVLGCRIARGVESKMFSRPVWMAAFNGWLTPWEIAAKEPASRAIARAD